MKYIFTFILIYYLLLGIFGIQFKESYNWFILAWIVLAVIGIDRKD